VSTSVDATATIPTTPNEENDMVSNIYEYSRKFGGIKFHPGKVYLLLDLLGEVCWYCSKRKTVHHVQHTPGELEKMVLMHHGRCQKCERTRMDMIRDRLYDFPAVANLVIGQRGGKDILAALLVGYYNQVSKTVGKLVVCHANISKSGEWKELTQTMHTAGPFPPLFTEGRVLSKTAWQSFPEHPGLLVFNESAWLEKKDRSIYNIVPAFEDLRKRMGVQYAVSKRAVANKAPETLPAMLVSLTSPRVRGDICWYLRDEAVFDHSIYNAWHPVWDVTNLKKSMLTKVHDGDPTAKRDFALEY